MTEPDSQSPSSGQESLGSVETRQAKTTELIQKMVELYSLAIKLNKERNSVVEGALQMGPATFDLLQADLGRTRAELIDVETELRLMGNKDPRHTLHQELAKLAESSAGQPDQADQNMAQTEDTQAADPHLLAEIGDQAIDAVTEQEAGDLDTALRINQGEANLVEEEERSHASHVLDDLTRLDRNAVAADDAELLKQLERERRRPTPRPKNE